MRRGGQSCILLNEDELFPDGITIEFYQSHESTLKFCIMALIRNFLDGCGSIEHFNSMFLSLILKVNAPTKLTHYRLVSCFNVIDEVISKQLGRHLILLLPELLSRGRNIEDKYAFVSIYKQGRTYIGCTLVRCWDGF